MISVRPLYHFGFLAAKKHSLGVEPRGFEPLTSAVQSQNLLIASVRSCSEIPAKQPIRLYVDSLLFAVVRVGWCTTGVNET
jgi:hypothetical protein